MSVVSFFSFKELEVVYIFFMFLCWLTYEMVSDEKLSQAEQKKKQKIGLKPFYSNTSYSLEYEKTAWVNYLLKCS